MVMDFQNVLQNLISWGLAHGIKILVILIAAQIVSRFGKIFIKRLIRKVVHGKDEVAEKKREDTLNSIFVSTFKFTVWIIAITTVVPEFGINIGPILAGAGLIGLAVGMGARSLIQDYISGVFIVLEDQYRVGDTVIIAKIEGKVKEVTLRRTILQDNEGLIHSIPNGQVKTSANKNRK